MKQIYLLRHAKSSWEDLDLEDKERHLASRGKKQIKALREYFHYSRIAINLALVSPAERTKKTYQLLRKDVLRLPKPDYRTPLYEAEWEDLLFLIHGIENSINSVIIVGHNPGLENLANVLLFGHSEPSRFKKFPTASFLGLQCSGDSWKGVESGTCQLEHFWIPGALGKE